MATPSSASKACARILPGRPRPLDPGYQPVEFCGDEPFRSQRPGASLRRALAGADTSVERTWGIHWLKAPEAVTRVYVMRKRSVGLLGNVEGEVRPQPFVEDTAVPPEQLADYIADFRALLDGYGLAYGMFGHVDAGVLHVRPALDMKDPAQAALVKPISDAVAALTSTAAACCGASTAKACVRNTCRSTSVRCTRRRSA